MLIIKMILLFVVLLGSMLLVYFFKKYNFATSMHVVISLGLSGLTGMVGFYAFKPILHYVIDEARFFVIGNNSQFSHGIYHTLFVALCFFIPLIAFLLPSHLITVKKNLRSGCSDLYLVAAIGLQIVLALYWLIVENASIYGDESFFILSLFQGMERIGDVESFREFLKNIYFFNDRYPSFLFIFSSPFVLLSENIVLSVRIAIGILHVFSVGGFYLLLRSLSNKMAAFLGILILSTSLFWVHSCHYYLTDSPTPFFLIFFLLLYSLYLRTNADSYLWASGLVLTFGFLTKFSFVIYITPALCVALILEIYTLRYVKRKIKKILWWGWRLFLFPLVVTGPWYFENYWLGNKMNAIKGYALMKNYQYMLPIKNIFNIFSQIIIEYRKDLPSYLLGFMTLIVIIWLIQKIYLKRSFAFNPILRANYFIVFSAIGIILFSSSVLGVLGRLTIARWNFNYLVIVILFCFSFHRINFPKHMKTILILFISVASIVPLIDTHFKNLRQGSILRTMPLLFSTRIPILPKTQPVNMQKIAQIISEHYQKSDKSQSSQKMVANVANFHIHGGAHANAINLYLRMLSDANVRCVSHKVMLAIQEPVYLEAFIRYDYLIFRKASNAPWWLKNWVRFSEHLPQNYLEALEKIGSVHSRFGEFTIYYFDKRKLSKEITTSLIATGIEVEKGTEFEVFWRIADIIDRLYAESDEQELRALESQIVHIKDTVNEYQQHFSPYLFERLKSSINQMEEAYKQRELRYRQQFQLSNKILFSLNNKIQRAALKLSRDIKLEEVSSDGMFCFKTTSDNPYLLLPPLQFNVGEEYILRTEITVPAATTMQIYYSDIEDMEPLYNERRSQKVQLHYPYRYDLFIKLDSRTLGPNIRFDPGTSLGRYCIHQLEIREAG